ncbi:MAG: FtsW/RodA/SpoVE family cell cycle protein [Oscillospiraceae bacterium]
MGRVADLFREFFRKGDMLLLSLCLLASGMGLVLIYSATRYLNSNRSLLVQVIAILIGIGLYFALTFIDIELFTEKTWKWMLLFNVFIILLLLTPFGVGEETTGNNSWLAFPFLPMNIQPAEIAKLFFVLILALQCSKYQEFGISRPTSVLRLAGHTILMCGLIGVTSSDFGMVLVYLFLFVLMAWSGGVQKRWFALGFAGIAGAAVLMWSHLPTYIQKRVITVVQWVFFGVDYEPQGAGWQQSHSVLAIGSGGLTGQGYLQGTQTQQGAIPAQRADEIFAVCGEEFGLIGCIAVVLVLTAIILRCIWVSKNARSPMCAFAAMGYAAMLMIQTAINIGTCLYVFPVVGLTLPFFSYGGSSIITLFAAMGVVSSIKARPLPSWLKDRTKFRAF